MENRYFKRSREVFRVEFISLDMNLFLCKERRLKLEKVEISYFGIKL